MWQRAACASYCTACTVDRKGERGASVGTLLAWLNALPEGLSLCVCLHVYVCTCKTEMYFEGKLNPAQTSYIQLFSFTCVNRVLGMYRKQGPPAWFWRQLFLVRYAEWTCVCGKSFKGVGVWFISMLVFPHHLLYVDFISWPVVSPHSYISASVVQHTVTANHLKLVTDQKLLPP